MEHNFCKSIDELHLDELHLSADFRTNFVEKIGLAELIFNIRYHSVLCEDQLDEVVDAVIWEHEYDAYYGFDQLDVRKYEAELTNLYCELKENGYIRDYTEFIRITNLYHILKDGDEYWEDLLSEEDAIKQNHRYETERQISNGELAAILKVFQNELPFMQYEMIKFTLVSTINATLSREEKDILKLAQTNAAAAKEQVVKILGKPLF